jgi:inosine triphosphate pyrophosphatase
MSSSTSTAGGGENNHHHKNTSNSNNNNKLLMVVGSANQDLISTTNTIPIIGETVMGHSFVTTFGGKGANQAIAASRLQLLPVTMVCRVGNDVFGYSLLNNFKEAGVTYDETKTMLTTDSTTTTTTIASAATTTTTTTAPSAASASLTTKPTPATPTTDDIPSGVATIIVDSTSGDNMIIVTPGANYGLTSIDVQCAIEQCQPSYILVQLEILPDVAFTAVSVGKQMGAITFLNAAPAPPPPSSEGRPGWTLHDPHRDFFQHVDVLILNESELKAVASSISSSSSPSSCSYTTTTTTTTTNNNNNSQDDTAGSIPKTDTLKNDNNNNEVELLAKSLLMRGVGKAVVVTLGSRGALIIEKTTTRDTGGSTSSDNGVVVVEDDYLWEVNYIPVPEDLPGMDQPVRDTVGAGDAFCGALVSYWSTGLTLPMAAQYACGVASITVRSVGAQPSYPTYQELPDCLKVLPNANNAATAAAAAAVTTTDTTTLKRQKMSTSKPSITFVTGNKKKLEEIKQILSKGKDIPFEVINQKIDLPELQGDTIEIAKEKCRLASQSVNGPVFIEDTSLCFNALNGLPGPYIKWFLERCGHDGLNRMLDGFVDRSAYAQTIVAYTTGPQKEIHVFDGRTTGKIVPPRGPLDFGWDPVFEPDEGDGMTYAEMPKDFKNSISHRGRSFEKFREFLISSSTLDDVDNDVELQTMEES